MIETSQFGFEFGLIDFQNGKQKGGDDGADEKSGQAKNGDAAQSGEENQKRVQTGILAHQFGTQ